MTPYCTADWMTSTNADSVKVRARNTSCRKSVHWAKSNLQVTAVGEGQKQEKWWTIVCKKRPRWDSWERDRESVEGREQKWEVFITQEANMDQKPRSQKHTLRQTELQLGFLKVSRAVDLVAFYFRVFFNDLHGMPPPLITASVINRMK